MCRLTTEDSFLDDDQVSNHHLLITVDAAREAPSAPAPCSPPPRLGCLSLPFLWIRACHLRSNGHEGSVAYYRVQEGYFPGQWIDSRYSRARHARQSRRLRPRGFRLDALVCTVLSTAVLRQARVSNFARETRPHCKRYSVRC